jgi:hypothetical protein
VIVTSPRGQLRQRVIEACETALADRQFVTAADVLTGLGWIAPVHVDLWQQGRLSSLDQATQVSTEKITTVIELLTGWAQDRGLIRTEITYVARTRERQELRFTLGGDPELERRCRTHWISPQLSERKREQIVERESKPADLLVISPLKDWTCTECSRTGDLLLMEGPGPLCLRCADLDHLVFLPAGDATVTRRAKKASGLSAVVVRFSRSRKRYERQGLLVEEAALDSAERACLADADARARRALRDQERRVNHDAAFHQELAREIVRLFSGCPAGRAEAIARHAGARGSGRVARTAAGRALDPHAVELAVAASIRHEDTDYDQLLMSGLPRAQARDRVRADVRAVLESWREPTSVVTRGATLHS